MRAGAVKGGSQRSQNNQGPELSIDPGALIPSLNLLGVSWSSAGGPGWKPKPGWGLSSHSCYLKGYHEPTLWARARRAWPRNVLITWISFIMSITVIPSEYFSISLFTFSTSPSFVPYQLIMIFVYGNKPWLASMLWHLPSLLVLILCFTKYFQC